MSENAIQIVLPVWESNLDLTEDEKMIYGILSKNRLKSMGKLHHMFHLEDQKRQSF